MFSYYYYICVSSYYSFMFVYPHAAATQDTDAAAREEALRTPKP